MLNPRKSKINKLIIDKCNAIEFKEKARVWDRTSAREIVKCFKSLTIIDTNDMVEFCKKCKINGLEKLHIIDQQNLTSVNPNNYSNLTDFGINKFSFYKNQRPLKKLFLNRIDELELFEESSSLCSSITVKYPPWTIRDTSNLKVSDLTILNEECSLSLDEIMRKISVFEHVVIPETFIRLNTGTLSEIANPKLRRITIMTTRQNRIIVKILRARLECMFPNACIFIKEMKEKIINEPSKQFGTFKWEDEKLGIIFERLLRRIDSVSNQCIYLREEASKTFIQQINESMKKLGQLFEDRNSTDRNVAKELMIFETETYILEGLKANIEFALQNVKHAIEIYQELIGKDETISRVISQYQETLNSSVSGQFLNQNLKLLEESFDTMKNHFEMKGFSHKLLFKNLWQADDVVEFYRDEDFDIEDEEELILDEEDNIIFDQEELSDFNDEEYKVVILFNFSFLCVLWCKNHSILNLKH
ncbi:predicted protein [Naegleria gruberi]|uniref:Predicted protein n=1 Tax=Naegleria gruberi TaxID=5762 RepID=D2V236_NAEGR|nr:uncharacterized protein NAEGRDRAFT_62865 [Naegleria gruberi]EFC48984.1 predicted protein [Naegleria gruberi]|eukprot:XP_002681728.1 predicted protein [Naegleria gruberi strain NEG-M]